MRRIAPIALLAPLLMAAEARSQYVSAGSGGSTAQGDYLRGLGIAAWGMGSYNQATAVADSIYTDTAMRLDSYLSEKSRQARLNWMRIERERQARFKENYEAIRQRIREHPEWLDVQKGAALNAIFDQLNDASINDSSRRAAPVRFSVEDVRKVPFTLGKEGLSFSMQRLYVKGRWPVGFQADRFDAARKAYEIALDDALEHMIEKKMSNEVIQAYESAVHGLENELKREFGVNRQLHYNQAMNRIAEMRKAAELFKSTPFQQALAELDGYAGTTVDDLRVFMLKHGLRFATAESPEERGLYPGLYAALAQVREVVGDDGGGKRQGR